MFDVSKFAVKAVKAWVAIRGRFLRAKVALAPCSGSLVFSWWSTSDNYDPGDAG